MLLAGPVKFPLYSVANKKNSGAIKTQPSMRYMLAQVIYLERKVFLQINT